MRGRVVATVILFLLPVAPLAAGGIHVAVLGGGEQATDWVVEQPLDMGAAARLLGLPGAVNAEQIVVVELDAGGNAAGIKRTQVDAGDIPGQVVVSWLVDGALAPGQSRRFRIDPVGRERSPESARAIAVRVEGPRCVIRNSRWSVTHDADRGGLITALAVEGEEGGVRVPLSFGERAYDGEVYGLGGHKALETRVLANGPLRAVYELRQDYQGAKGRPPTRPTAVYRWTSFAGVPVTRVDATIRQAYARRWDCLMFLEIGIGEAVSAGALTQGITGEATAPWDLTVNDRHYGREWSAVFGPGALIGVLKADDNFVYRRSFIRGAYIAPWYASETRRRSYLFWGRGRRDVPEVARWNRILTDPPRATVHLAPLAERIADLEKALAASEQALPGIAASVARMKLSFARSEAGAGRFGRAERACADAQEILDPAFAAVGAQKGGGVRAGVIAGSAFIENREVSMVFADSGNGAGLVSVRDRATGREFLDPDLADAPLWRVAFRRKEGGGATLCNVGVPCAVSVDADPGPGEAALTFDWRDLQHGEAGDIGNVRVTVRLRQGESLARARIEATAGHADYGLSQVVFPVVAGIWPLTPDARGDFVLDTKEVGTQVASPLRSGAPLQVDYPFGLQFSAVHGGGHGLYFAEEDPHACSKQIEFIPDAARGTLSFHISHPVPDYAGAQPVRGYRLPGDLVLGPFQGDWYDACRLYRKWATASAPWCGSGPIAGNPDYPKWLADASYWTIDYTPMEMHIEQAFARHAFYGVPGHAVHLYGWFFPHQQDDRYPEYFPPRLGPENFLAVLKRFREAGMRVVPYVNGFMWDADTESYRTKDVARAGALLDAYGREMATTSYGGQKLVFMCPASRLWRETLLDVSRELVGRYGVDGVYFDFLNPHNRDCFAPGHGHHLGGGDFWSKSVQGLYRMIRREMKAINPDFMMTGEKIAEPFIGLLDTFYCSLGVDTTAPLFMAVYHDHALVYGASGGDGDPVNTGRSFILGKQNGWGAALATADQKAYFKMLLACHDRFARPYLSYGQMLRMPAIHGDLPAIRGKAGGGYEVPAVEGTAWRAPDGRVGLIFVNYDREAHEFDWALDLQEARGWDGGTALRMSRWTPADGLCPAVDVTGGALRRKETLGAWGLLCVQLEAAP